MPFQPHGLFALSNLLFRLYRIFFVATLPAFIEKLKKDHVAYAASFSVAKLQ
jgi:hypothetical protein